MFGWQVVDSLKDWELDQKKTKIWGKIGLSKPKMDKEQKFGVWYLWKKKNNMTSSNSCLDKDKRDRKVTIYTNIYIYMYIYILVEKYSTTVYQEQYWWFCLYIWMYYYDNNLAKVHILMKERKFKEYT